VSPSLPVVSGRAVGRALAKVGFAEVSQRGSHLKLRDPAGKTVIAPLHRELARGTLRSIRDRRISLWKRSSSCCDLAAVEWLPNVRWSLNPFRYEPLATQGLQ